MSEERPGQCRTAEWCTTTVSGDALGMCELSTQLIAEAAIRRGLQIEVLDPFESLIRIHSPCRSEILSQATKTRLDSLVVDGVLRSKGACKQLLRAAGLPVLSGWWCTAADALGSLSRDLLAEDRVVKPNVQYGGNGVGFVRRGRAEELELAVQRAAKLCPTLIIEPWIHFPEYRFLIIAGRVHSIVNRVPAHVVGDGVSTITQLVVTKNAQRHALRRGPEYDIRLGPEESQCLRSASRTFDSVPVKGQHVRLRWNSNAHCGGDLRLVNCHSRFRDFAASAAKTLGVAVCGLDVLAEDISMPPGPGRQYILEANFNPDLTLHAIPTEGPAADPSDALLDALGL